MYDGADLIGGSTNQDTSGRAGNDTIIGRGGEDLLDGGSGDDLFLLASSGTRVCSGDGADIFQLNHAVGSERIADRVMDASASHSIRVGFDLLTGGSLQLFPDRHSSDGTGLVDEHEGYGALLFLVSADSNAAYDVVSSQDQDGPTTLLRVYSKFGDLFEVFDYSLGIAGIFAQAQHTQGFVHDVKGQYPDIMAVSVPPDHI